MKRIVLFLLTNLAILLVLSVTLKLLGVDRVTIENLQVVRVDAERNLLLIRGAVPGAPGGEVFVRHSVKAARRAARVGERRMGPRR